VVGDDRSRGAASSSSRSTWSPRIGKSADALPRAEQLCARQRLVGVELIDLDARSEHGRRMSASFLVMKTRGLSKATDLPPDGTAARSRVRRHVDITSPAFFPRRPIPSL